jgi:hypothetical protein
LAAKAERLEAELALHRARRITEQPDLDWQVKVFSVHRRDVDELIKALSALFPHGPTSQVYFASDSRTKSIIARGTASDLAVVEAILLRLNSE